MIALAGVRAKNRNPLLPVTAGVFLLWIIVSYLFRPNPTFFPPPLKVAVQFLRLIQTSQFWLDVLASFIRVAVGFILSILIAYPVVIYSAQSRGFKKVAFLLVEFFRYLPVPVFIPLTIVWFGVDNAGKIFIIFLGAFAQMIPMFDDSVQLLNNKFNSYSSALKWPRWSFIRHIIIPGSAPLIWDNARICFGWAWTYLVIAELLGAENGLGFAIIRAQRYLATDEIFAYVFTIGLIGLGSDRAISYFKRKLFKWQL
jgi:NitT/TauT family transport system permease protein